MPNGSGSWLCTRVEEIELRCAAGFRLTFLLCDVHGLSTCTI
jgi:hypothetical protein